MKLKTIIGSLTAKFAAIALALTCVGNVWGANVAKIGNAEYTSLANAVAAVPTDGTATTIVMLSDVKLSAYVTIAATKNVTLDLNGKTITTTVSSGKHKYAIANNGTLVLKDSAGTGSISARGVYNGFDSTTATMTIESGTYTAIDTDGGAAILNKGKLVVNGGTFNGKMCMYNSGSAAKMTVNGATVNGADDYAIKNVSGGTLTINDITVNGVHGSFLQQDGGATTINGGTFVFTGVEGSTTYDVYVKGGSLTIAGGSFLKTGNLDLTDEGSCILHVDSPATATVTGGEFASAAGTAAGLFSGAISVKGGSFEIENGTTADVAGYAAAGYAIVNFSGNTSLYRVFMDNWERPDYADLSWYTANPSASTFEISSAAQFAGLAQLVNGKALNADGTPCGTSGGVTFSQKTITLTADIDLSAHGWVPIGYDPYTQDANVDYAINKRFAGTFDGGGHTIKFVLNEQNSIYDDDALFGSVSRGTLKNIVLDATISYPGEISAGYWNPNIYGAASGLVTFITGGVVSNVTMNGSVVMGSRGASGAGLVGYAFSGPKFYDCVNNTSVTIKPYYTTKASSFIIWGGIVSQITGNGSDPVPAALFTRCVNNATVVMGNPYNNDRMLGGSDNGYGSMNRLSSADETEFYSCRLHAGGIVGQLANAECGYLVQLVDCEDNGSIVGGHAEKFDSEGHYSSLYQKGSFYGKVYEGGSSTPVDYSIDTSDRKNKVFYTYDNTYIFNAEEVDLSSCTHHGEGSYYRPSTSSSGKIVQKVGGAEVEVTDADTIASLNNCARLVGPVIKQNSRVVFQTIPNYVAQIVGVEKFESLQAAIDAAKDGDTVTLLKDVAIDSSLTVETSITLDLNGFGLEVPDNNNTPIFVNNDATTTLTIVNSNSSTPATLGDADTKKSQYLAKPFAGNIVIGAPNSGAITLTTENIFNRPAGAIGTVTINEGVTVTAGNLYIPAKATTINGGTFNGSVHFSGSENVVTINGGVFKNNVDANSSAAVSSISITGGDFTKNPSPADVPMTVSGGTFRWEVPLKAEYIANGCSISVGSVYEVSTEALDAPAVEVSFENGKKLYYSTLNSRVFTACDGATVKLLTDIALDSTLGFGSGTDNPSAATLDLNGHVLSYSDYYDTLSVNAYATVTVRDTSASGNGKITNGYAEGDAVYLSAGASFVLESGTLEAIGADSVGIFTYGGDSAAELPSAKSISISGGAIGAASGLITTNGGAVDVAISGGIFSHEPDAAHIVDGYVAVGNTDEATKVVYPWMVGRAVAQIDDVKYVTLVEAIAAADEAGVEEITILDDSITTSPNDAWKIADGKLVRKVYVAQVGDHRFETLSEAIAAVPTDGTETTIQMIADETIAGNQGVTIASEKNVVLDLNGHEVVLAVAVANADTFLIQNNGSLTINDSSTGGRLYANGEGKGGFKGKFAILNYGRLTVNGGVISAKSTNAAGASFGVANAICSPEKDENVSVAINGGTLTAEGGAFGPLVSAPVYLMWNSDSSALTFTMSGGVLSGSGLDQCVAVYAKVGNNAAARASFNFSGGELQGVRSALWVDGFDTIDYQNVSTTISSGVFTGYNEVGQTTELALDVLAGSLNITGGTFNYGSYLRTHQIDISGGSFAEDVIVYRANGTANARISDGTFDGEVIVDGTSGNITVDGDMNLYSGGKFISGGNFAVAVQEKLCASGYLCTTAPVANGYYQVVPAAKVTFELGEGAPNGAVAPEALAYPSGNPAETALPQPTYTSTDKTFAGWKVGGEGDAISTLPAGTTGNITLVATWTGVKTVTITESATTVPIKVTDEWIGDNVTPDAGEATTEEIQAALNKEEANGNKAWENYVLGLDGSDPNANVAADAAQGPVSATPITSNVDVPAVDTGFKVEYKLVSVDTNGTTVTQSALQPTPDLTADIAAMTSETNVVYYKTVAVITSTTDPNVTVEVPSTNTIGVLKVESGAKTTAVAVPWASYDGTNDISVADIVRTANLTPGDELKAYAPDGSGYKAWTLNESKEWEPNITATKTDSSVAPTADDFKVKRGSAVWLTRADPSQPIYLVGGVAATEKVSVALESKKGDNDPSWNLVGSAGTEPIKVSEIAAETDKIVVPTAYIPKEYEYNTEKGGWGYWDYVTETKKNGRKTVNKVWKAAEDIPAGTGFWYLNGGDSKDINL